VVEQYYTENSNEYPDDATATAVPLVFEAKNGGTEGKANASPGVTLKFKNVNNSASYRVCAKHASGGQWWTYDSVSGSLNKSGQDDCGAVAAPPED
jgi:hypothetical protein